MDEQSAAAAGPASLPSVASRFLTLDEIAEDLNVTKAQVYALVRRKELVAVKLGGRGQWRVAREDLDAYLEQAKVDTAKWIDEHPFADGTGPDDEQA